MLSLDGKTMIFTFHHSFQYFDFFITVLAYFVQNKKQYSLRLKLRHLFLTVLEAEQFKIKVPADSVLGEGPLLACR